MKSCLQGQYELAFPYSRVSLGERAEQFCLSVTLPNLTARFSKAYKFPAVGEFILWELLKTATACNEGQIYDSYVPRHSSHAGPIRDQS